MQVNQCLDVNLKNCLNYWDWVKFQWNKFDDVVMKPFFLYNWPESIIQHEDLTLKVKKLFNEYYRTRKSPVTKNIQEIEIPEMKNYNGENLNGKMKV
jgi:hypothetical protein